MRRMFELLAALLALPWWFARACREEERDAELLAADAGMTPEEWREANRAAGL